MVTAHNNLLRAINRDDLLATVPHLAADRLPRLAIALLLFLGELLRGRPAARGALPTGELVVAPLRVAMAMAVDAVNADPLALGTEVVEIRAVGGIPRRHQALTLGQRLGLVEEQALLRGPDGDPDFPPALFPGILEHQLIAAIGPVGDDLDRGFAAKAEVGLLSPSIGPDGTLYIGDYHYEDVPGTLYAFGPPAPLIFSLSPNVTAAGGPDFTVAVNGSGFAVGAKVQWNGAALPTTYIADNQLKATIPSLNIVVAGTALVTVSNPSPGGGPSTPAMFTIVGTPRLVARITST